MRIPSQTKIVNRALDFRADALNQNDSVTVSGIDCLIRNMYRGARLKWSIDGALQITSCNTPGAVYTTTQHTCSCPARKPCWHLRAFDLLVGMLDTESESADIAALA